MVGDWDGAGCSRALIRPHQAIPYVEFTEKHATHPHHASFTPILREKRASKTNPVHSRDAPCVRPARLRASSIPCVRLPIHACVLLSTRASCMLARPTNGHASCRLVYVLLFVRASSHPCVRPARLRASSIPCVRLPIPACVLLSMRASCMLARPTNGHASCRLVYVLLFVRASCRLPCVFCPLGAFSAASVRPAGVLCASCGRHPAPFLAAC
jgi:hypothetical protein